MTFEITEARQLLAIDEIEISRLRATYQTESLASALSSPIAGKVLKNKKLSKWVDLRGERSGS